MIGYDKNGVKYSLGRSGRLTYISETSSITSWGDILGSDNIPQGIREQIAAYRDGRLTDDAAREAYLAALSPPEPQPEQGAAHPYQVGDVVFLENQECTIQAFGDKDYGDGVVLTTSSNNGPIEQWASYDNFEGRLWKDIRNRHITNHLSAAAIDSVSEEVLHHILQDPEIRRNISRLFEQKMGNNSIAGYLQSRFYTYDADTINLIDGTPADYSTNANGLQVEFELMNGSMQKTFCTWEYAAPFIRRLWEQGWELDWVQEQEEPAKQQSPATQPSDYSYTIGDTVWLDGNAKYTITEIIDNHVIVELVPGQNAIGIVPSIQNLTKASFERELRNNYNAHVTKRPQQEKEAAEQEKPTASPKQPYDYNYNVGDTVYMEDGERLTIASIDLDGDMFIELEDGQGNVVEMSIPEFLGNLDSNPQNDHLRVTLTQDEAELLADSGRAAVEEMGAALPDPGVAVPPVPKYVFDFQYINDRLIVFDVTHGDPDEFSPIVARVEPDGSIVYLDETLSEPQRLEIQHVAENELERYKEEAEASLQQMLDHAKSVVDADAAKARPKPGRSAVEKRAQRHPGPGTAAPRVPDAAAPPELAPNQHIEIIDGVEFVVTTASPRQQPAPTPRRQPKAPTAGNFRITDDTLGEGGQKTKYAYNIAAIRVLKQIEAEHRHATSAEQETLSRYVGWGGISQAFDGANDKWAREYAELKDLLTPEEYAAARTSTLNAHYTTPTVIKAMYGTLGRLGFDKGNLLEPAMGAGNFFGLLPESMGDSRLYGVELDSITGRIAQELYPDANIQVKGFQDAEYPDSFFDAAIGNVPFGDYPVADKRYDKNHFLIHDYFFAKTLDKVRPGGVVAFVTSSGTMDKQNSSVRKYLAQRAELLGAVRLPNTAFLKNAGTEVTTDILFLQKRDRLVDLESDWVHLGQSEEGLPVNQYFAEHPEMVLGTLALDKSMYGSEQVVCNPLEGADLSEQLHEALSHIEGEIGAYTLDDVPDLELELENIPADPAVRNHSYTVVDGSLYFRENSVMRPTQTNKTAAQRITGMIAVRDCARSVLDMQERGCGDGELQQAQAELNRLYDAYTRRYGLMNSNGNKLAFSEDASYPLLCSLENLDEDGNLKSKADIFTKRTVRAEIPITHVDTAQEALAVSLSERACVDMDFMCSLLDEKGPEIVQEELQGVIFKDPASDPDDLLTGWQSADEYLSGNVREKLAQAEAAAQADPRYTVNAEALRQVQPKDLTATEIEVKLGTTWIPQEDYTTFVQELLGVPNANREDFSVRYIRELDTYRVNGNQLLGAVQTPMWNTYGSKRINALGIIARTLNGKAIQIFDTKIENGNEVRKFNKTETDIAQNRQEKIKRAFRDWIWRDPARRERLCNAYNTKFNSVRPRSFDGSHLRFPGMNAEVALEPHQKDAVARQLYGGNTLLAHVVGAGKTYEMIAAAMEKKRLGLVQKPLFTVPNHLTEQWGADILKLYPGANVLVATKKDFEPHNRKKFCSRIATGNYDAVVMGHSQFERIPLSKERQVMAMRMEVDDLTAALDMVRQEKGERYTVKQLEKTRQRLQEKIKALTDETRKDEVVTFEQLGVDMLFVDEAHIHKNLFLYTKMQRVAGISGSASQRASDMYWKTGYLDELTGGKGVVFATGTPISNSMTELYTMERYLMRERLKELDMAHFDQWASSFGDTVTDSELSPEGKGLQMKTRFSRFFNLPEVVGLFKEVADIKTADQLNLPRPKANYHDVVLEASEYQEEIIDSLADRADAVRKREVEPHVDNMLKVTGDGRKTALDQRLINPLLPDNPEGKAAACADKVFEIYGKTAAQKSTQLIFCDTSTPKGEPLPMREREDGGWELDREKYRFTNVYDDIKVKLIERGIPPHEIAYIHEAKNDKQKAELFRKVRSGEVRVLLGSTEKMGAGTNVQDKLIALHHLDVPWKPSDIEQQEGRILRRGNDNPEVDIYRYITKGTFDAYSWQIIERKQKFIGQVMTSKSPARSCEDLDETALSYAEVKALATGDPRFKEKMDLDVEIAKLRNLKSDHDATIFQYEDDLVKRIPKELQAARTELKALDIAQQALAAHPVSADRFSMEVDGKLYTERKAAGQAIIALCLAEKPPEGKIGSYRGFDMHMSFDAHRKLFQMKLKKGIVLDAQLSEDPVGTVSRIGNALEAVPRWIQERQETIAGLEKQTVDIQAEVKKPFPYAAEMEQKEERLATLLRELAEAEKEQTAKRQEKKQAQGNFHQSPGEGKAITQFLQDFKPQPSTKPPLQTLEQEW